MVETRLRTDRTEAICMSANGHGVGMEPVTVSSENSALAAGKCLTAVRISLVNSLRILRMSSGLSDRPLRRLVPEEVRDQARAGCKTRMAESPSPKPRLAWLDGC